MHKPRRVYHVVIESGHEACLSLGSSQEDERGMWHVACAMAGYFTVGWLLVAMCSKGLLGCSE